MVHYRYVVVKCTSDTVVCKGLLRDVEHDTVVARVYQECLNVLRMKRYRRLLQRYTGDITDAEAVAEYVPDPFKSHVGLAHEVETGDGIYYELLGQMASLWIWHTK